jgi:hypothetical protein
MAGGDAFVQAVTAAKERKGLSVGLHITLCDGKSVLLNSAIRHLADRNNFFLQSAATVWLKLSYKTIMAQAEAEVRAQFDRLEAEGIRPSYVDGHHHLHMHPGLFEVVCRIAAERGVLWIRLPAESLAIVAGFRSRSRGFMPFVEWAVFGVLQKLNRRTAKKYGLRCATKVYGLSATGDMDEKRVVRLLDRIANDKSSFMNELFFHPDLATESGLKELLLLKSQKLRSKLDSLCIKRIGYSVNNDLFPGEIR